MPGWGGPPPGGAPQGGYGGPPPPPYGGMPPHGGQPAGGPPSGGGPGKGVLIAIAAALAVVIIAVAAWAGLRSGGSDTADDPDPTQPTTTQTQPSPTTEPSPTESTTEPTPAPTSLPTVTKPTVSPAEPRRTVPDVDSGTAVYDDVYLQAAPNWRSIGRSTFQASVGRTGHGIYRVIVLPFGMQASTAANTNRTSFAKALKVTGLVNGPAAAIRPPNANIASAYKTNFTGRIKTGSRTVSVAGHCTALTGVESIHNVTAVACLVTPQSTAAAANRDAAKMLSSVARSI